MATIVGLVVVLIGLGGIALGGLYLTGAVPVARQGSAYSAYTSIAVGLLLVALGVLRLAHML